MISLPDTPYFESSASFINDSTAIHYTWDEQTKTIKGTYDQSKLSRAQIMSYYLGDNEFLFINSHYKLLKQMLSDEKQRKWALIYLEKVKTESLK